LRWWGRAMFAERFRTEAHTFPTISVRGRSILALVIAPAAPLEAWLDALDDQTRRAPGLFSGRPVVADLTEICAAGFQRPLCVEALDALAARNLKLIGVESADPELLSGTSWSWLPAVPRGREAPQDPGRGRQAGKALLIDRPVRSGQSIVCDDGDVTVVGAVASGAEVVAGGSIHVYGPLRGRAIAGVTAGKSARIFCRALEAELVAVGGVYRLAESWSADLRGRAAQICCEGEALRLTVLE
jgi:septum site-determining protein MinC